METDLTHAPTETINRVDLKLPHRKMMKEKARWTETQGKAVERAYRQFLYLLWRYPERRLVPHKHVDQLWHQHILCTRSYTDFCQELAGRYLHHEPSEGLDLTDQDRKDYRETRRLLVHHFGPMNDPEMTLSGLK